MLTNSKIKHADPQEKPFILSDSQGLYLLVKPSGSKLWRFQYQFDGKARLLALGQYPDTSLAMARTAHAAARVEIAKGIDPGAQRKAQKQAVKAQAEEAQRKAANSFQRIAMQWHAWWAKGVDAETAAYILRRLEADVFPDLGSMAIEDIKAADIRKLILEVEKRGARDVAQREYGTIGQVFRYAVAHDLVERNPAADLKPSDILRPRKTQHRAHIEPNQLSGLLVAMDDYSGHLTRRYAMKLMTMLFVRTAELLQAPWSEFDLDNAVWKIAPERMKKERPHIVPLPRQAVAILRELKQLAGDKPFMFPGMNKQTQNGTINCNTLLNVLKELGYKSVMTGHGFRGLARTILADNGFIKEHVELQLSHTNDDKTDAAYNHALYLTQRTEIMQWWADHLDAELLKGRAKIVAIRKLA